MSINIKKYTKEQMAKMVEEAQEEAHISGVAEDRLRSELFELKAKSAALTEQINQMNGEAINKANEIANLKADADALRNKLADTEAALGRANAAANQYASALKQLHIGLCNAEQRADYAERHPWRNLWAWIKRKLGCKA